MSVFATEPWSPNHCAPLRQGEKQTRRCSWLTPTTKRAGYTTALISALLVQACWGLSQIMPTAPTHELKLQIIETTDPVTSSLPLNLTQPASLNKTNVDQRDLPQSFDIGKIDVAFDWTPPGPWREETLISPRTLNGNTLSNGIIAIRLADLVLPEADDLCQTLDGRILTCRERAATQLELLTRWRKVTCRYRISTPGEALGSCRLGEQDLSQRMIATGLVKMERAGEV